MSYDYPDDYSPPERVPLTLRESLVDRYWSFVLWCALDAPLNIINRWGLRRMRQG